MRERVDNPMRFEVPIEEIAGDNDEVPFEMMQIGYQGPDGEIANTQGQMVQPDVGMANNAQVQAHGEMANAQGQMVQADKEMPNAQAAEVPLIYENSMSWKKSKFRKNRVIFYRRPYFGKQLLLRDEQTKLDSHDLL